jgi:orotidine-5'-phosphate decarboxylase
LLKQKFKRVFLALDTNKLNEAIKITSLLYKDLAGIKIGKEMFSSYGPEIIKKFKKFKLPIFLDLKFHDIPTTVYKAVKAINLFKPNYLSIHSLGGDEMIQAAVKGSKYTKILSVQLLSHLDKSSIEKIGISISLKSEIKKLINIALKNNVHGLILAPKDLEIISKLKKNNIEIFVPGIRSKQNKKDEHKRFLDPTTAIKKGATYIIIGRPITKSKNPKKTLTLINEEIKEFLIKE